jgi:predicted metal-dependent HD superfamily phosphohydrolase
MTAVVAVGSRAQALWRDTWQLGARAAPPSLFETIAHRYAEPHRAYHDLAHVVACVEAMAPVRRSLADPFAAELALWYHDAVYDPRRSDNEEASAALAAAELAPRLPAPTVARVAAGILATRHPSQPTDADARYVVDADLAILGAEPAAFDGYESAVRREYAFVPDAAFARARRAALEALLARDRIYLTDAFAARFEQRARANLARSIARLH